MASRLSMFVSTLALSAIGLGTACASDPVRPPIEDDRRSGPVGTSAGGSPGTSDGGVQPIRDAGGLCTDLQGSSAIVDEIALVDDFIGAGGPLADGTYNIIEARLYLGNTGSGLPGPTNRSYQGSIRISDTRYESVLVTRTGGVAGPEVRTSGTLTGDGTTGATLALTCPSPAQDRYTYSATANGLTLSNPVTRVTFVYAKAP